MKARIVFVFMVGAFLLLPCAGFASQFDWIRHTVHSNSERVDAAYAVDMDLDGDLDILANGLGDITWWVNDGEQNFTRHLVADNLNIMYTVGAVSRLCYAVDLDRDGDLDLLGPALNTTEIAWWESDGKQNFTSHVSDQNSQTAAFVYAIDMDGDYDLDLMEPIVSNQQIAWWENDGAQNFVRHIVADGVELSRSVYAVDLDADGDLDILANFGSTDLVTWWENDGLQNYTERTLPGKINGTHSVRAVDIDGDRDVDIIGSNHRGMIAGWLNDGNGIYTMGIIDQSPQVAIEISPVDLDGDGDIDLLGAAGFSDEIPWWENDGDLNFTRHVIDGTVELLTAVYAVDLDRDGDLDIMSVARMANEVIWWENDGSQSFTRNVIEADFGGQNGKNEAGHTAFTVDLDMDGDLDILGSALYDGISWWENSTIPAETEIAVGLVADQFSVEVTAGGSFTYTGRLTSYAAGPVATDLWIEIETPDGGSFVVSRLEKLEVVFGEIGYYPIEQFIPVDALPGDYVYTVYAGDFYTRTVVDYASFNFYTKPLSAMDNSGSHSRSWDVSGWGIDPLAIDHLPIQHSMLSNFPNPFNAQTNVSFNVPVSSEVRLEVFNMLGQKMETLIDNHMTAGQHQISWEANGYASGIYFLRISQGNNSTARKVSLLK